MKIALVAVDVITNDAAYNFEKMETVEKEYSDKINLILFGEKLSSRTKLAVALIIIVVA
ncbi:hypothetical protein HZY91_04815 [Facklamia sp. DSM 111018]|uniref:Uncharacterized protein n=1 Tax=Facklamia lactis TaxID=2749967 RepID=A0ABS0LQD5_9LACT|nr:hypothetical protein [Facklamia lactis]MBG9986214.1 hypothetical protein [Facklamia lactis]